MAASHSLGETPIRSLFFQYYTPALVSILSVTLHQVVNGIILGQQTGKEGLAAVGLYGPVVIAFVSLTLPIMVGGGILIGKSLGASNYAHAQKIFQFATTLALLFGGTIALSTLLLADRLAAFLVGHHDELLVKNTSAYIFWQLLALPFFFLGMIWGNFIRTDNAPNISKNASLLAVVLNIVLDLFLIVGLDMGVKGASIATAISLFAGPLYLFIYIQKGKSHYTFRDFKFTIRLNEWRTLLMSGLPSFASELSFSCGLLLINQRIVPYGSSVISAFGLVNYMSFLFIRPFTAAMIASLPILSFNIGARLPHRVLEIFRFSLLFTFMLGLLISTLGIIIPVFLVRLFSGNETKEFEQLAIRATALYFLLFVAAGPNYILSAYLQSIGKSLISTLINVLKGIVFVALFLVLLPEYFGMGLDGVWLSRSLAEIMTFVLVGIYTLYHKEKYYTEKVILSKSY